MKRRSISRLLTLGTLLLVFGPVIASTLSEIDAGRKKALLQLEERALNGDGKALYDLARLHDTGYDTIPVDSARSTALYRLSALVGYAPAQNYLGYRYLKGEYVKEDVDSGLYWIAKAAGGGDATAANNLGFLLSNSDIVSRDYPQAVRWLSQAAQAGLPTAQSQLADLLRQGLGAAPDTLRAVNLYREAIAGGLHDAEFKLLNMMGPEWMQLPVDSLAILGREYYAGGAPIVGVHLLEKSAEEGNMEAMALLGDAYSRAVGVEYNHDKSVYWFLRSALEGHPSARFVIGELLDIFPDALNEPAYEEIIENYMGSKNNSGSISENISDFYSPQFWYEKAAADGVTDAESATQRLFNP